jgi:hypothetical protein
MRKLETYFIPEINSAFSQDDPPSLHGRFWNYSKLSPAFDAELNSIVTHAHRTPTQSAYN